MTVLSRRGPLYGVKGAFVHGGSDGEVEGTEAAAVSTKVVVPVVVVADDGDCTEYVAVVAGLGWLTLLPLLLLHDVPLQHASLRPLHILSTHGTHFASASVLDPPQ
mmetsp:Transcript_20514/g.30520  ORF Transcript_20514/g.30520 Transcript_20514/m.30520 type:complete len:106 (+) Transcript_20514:229-546(+)